MKLAPNPLLSDYLAEHVKSGVIDFSLRAQINAAGGVEFYIHPAHVSGRTEDYHLTPGRVEVMNKRGLEALVELAMRPPARPPKKKSLEIIDRTDLPRDEWINHVYDGLCHYCGAPKNGTEMVNLREMARNMAETYYDEDKASPADAVWNEVQASA